jgi:UPF0755 protein
MGLREKILLGLSFMLIIAVAVALVFEFSGPKLQQKETIEILRGENFLQIANDLKSEGYINSKLIFVFKAVRSGNYKKLQAGKYDFKGLGYDQIISKLSKGEVVARTITIVPGWDTQDIARSLDSGGLVGKKDFVAVAQETELRKEFDFLADLPKSADLEGYFCPDTYQIPEKPDAAALARLMLKNFDAKLTPDLRFKIKKQGKTIPDVVTMASMLEKEIKTLEDKKLVAGILWKRLDAKMPLQVDSTLLYYKVTSSKTIDKEIDSPYNTYRYSGMPPGPICNPGQESIEAAIEPLDSPYWYYLSAPDDTTIFSRNYGEHLINKAKYLDSSATSPNF